MVRSAPLAAVAYAKSNARRVGSFRMTKITKHFKCPFSYVAHPRRRRSALPCHASIFSNYLNVYIVVSEELAIQRETERERGRRRRRRHMCTSLGKKHICMQRVSFWCAQKKTLSRGGTTRTGAQILTKCRSKFHSNSKTSLCYR